jgi:hypothetical protein
VSSAFVLRLLASPCTYCLKGIPTVTLSQSFSSITPLGQTPLVVMSKRPPKRGSKRAAPEETAAAAAAASSSPGGNVATSPTEVRKQRADILEAKAKSTRSVICHKCNGPIPDKGPRIEKDGKVWHAKCFKCVPAASTGTGAAAAAASGSAASPASSVKKQKRDSVFILFIGGGRHNRSTLVFNTHAKAEAEITDFLKGETEQLVNAEVDEPDFELPADVVDASVWEREEESGGRTWHIRDEIASLAVVERELAPFIKKEHSPGRLEWYIQEKHVWDD